MWSLACPEARLSGSACPGIVGVGLELSLWRFHALPVPPDFTRREAMVRLALRAIPPTSAFLRQRFLASNDSDSEAAEEVLIDAGFGKGIRAPVFP